MNPTLSDEQRCSTSHSTLQLLDFLPGAESSQLIIIIINIIIIHHLYYYHQQQLTVHPNSPVEPLEDELVRGPVW